MDTAADRAREAARRTDGQFGEQHLADPGPSVIDFGHGGLWASLDRLEQDAGLAAIRAHEEYENRKSEWTRFDLAEEIVTAELPPGSIIRLTECHHFDTNPNNDPARTWVSIDEVYFSAADYLAGTTAGNPDYHTDMAYEVRLAEFWDDYQPTSTVVDFDQFTMDGHPDLIEVDKVLSWLREQVEPAPSAAGDRPPHASSA